MELESDLEPYRNAEAYRNLQPSTLPNHVERCLDFIDISEDGFLLLGSSNLTGRYWMGSLWYFIEPDAAPNVEKCLTGVDCETGICDGKFLEDQQKVIIGEDSGNIQILALCELPEEHTFHFTVSSSACDHDDYITSISVFKGKQQAVSGSADFTIKVWDVENMVADHTYRPAHRHQVSGVAAQPVNQSPVFASCSLDGSLLMWDSRNSKPASELLRGRAMTAVQWQPTQTEVVAVGSVAGDISFVDIRQPKQKLSKISCFQRSIHRILFDRNRQSSLAVCADHNDVLLLDCSDNSNPSISYRDGRHNDFVRGLAWHPKSGELFSCGWDKRVLTHSSAAEVRSGAGQSSEVTSSGALAAATGPATNAPQQQSMDVNGL